MLINRILLQIIKQRHDEDIPISSKSLVFLIIDQKDKVQFTFGASH